MTIDAGNKLAGILTPVFALRREGDLGIGDTIAFEDAIRFCQRHKIAVLQTLPINETGNDNSPYNAISSVAIDFMLLSMTPDKVPGLTTVHLQELVFDGSLSILRQGCIDYPRVKKLKKSILQAAFANFEKGCSDNKENLANIFQDFQKEHSSWLLSYSLFRTLVDEHGGNANWMEWNQSVQTLSDAEDWIRASPDSKRLCYVRRFWSYVQWVAFQQWDAVRKTADNCNVQLMGDIPFGISRYSADVWAHRQLFDLSWSGGAPPEIYFQGDAFTKKWGQNWGIPLYKWEQHKEENFSWWRQRVKNVTRHFHYFRIDHVLGFFRIYAFPWIPEKNGEYVNLTENEARIKTGGRLPQFLPRADEPSTNGVLNCAEGEAILRVLIETAGQTNIVAEDLGVVPDYVRPLLKKLNIPGFAIPIFERNEIDHSYKSPLSLPELSLVTYGTHDHVPLAVFYQNLVEWWHGTNGHEGWLEVQHLMRFLGLDENQPPTSFTDELYERLMSVLFGTPCWLAVLMITDLLGTTQRFNLPGSSDTSNWSERLDRTLDECELDLRFSKKIRIVEELIKKSQRKPISRIYQSSHN